MKKLFLLIIFSCLMVGVKAQNHVYNPDSAAWVIDRYIKILNYEEVEKDSTLFVKSVVKNLKISNDSIVMLRWFKYPNCNRIEVWGHDSLRIGLYTNGRDIRKEWNPDSMRWDSSTMEEYYDRLENYDFRGPLYFWRSKGCDVQYHGIWNMNGNQVYKIFVSAPGRYDRYYLFEKESGLLFMADEQKTVHEGYHEAEDVHISWRGYHEYIPLGECLFLRQESYQKDNQITVVTHSYEYLPNDKNLFEKDNR